MPIFYLVAWCVFGLVQVADQHLDVAIDPATHTVVGTSRFTVLSDGDLHVGLHPRAVIREVLVDEAPREVVAGSIKGLKSGSVVTMHWQGIHLEDVEAGEQAGEIHNHSVRAHAGQDGIFLSDGSNWHPQPLDSQGVPQLRTITLRINPISSWSLIASGNPTQSLPLDEPVWNWKTPRPVSGMAIAGNQHLRRGRTVETEHGEVEVVAQLSAKTIDKANYYLDASEDYLKMYTRLLGAYPFQRFTIVENFFSSGFAFPGFTLLGPRVIAMAPRSLKPGYLDHELVHAWWGNGVYVDPDDGNWCEAVTSFCTNYGRRLIEDGSDAARSYRRGIINQASIAPELDNGALGDFGRQGKSVDRFVGYQKGSFVFMMLQDILDEGDEPDEFADSRIWIALRDLADQYLGQRISWQQIQTAAEHTRPERPAGWLDPFFKSWIRDHTVPLTTPELTGTAVQNVEQRISPDGTQVLVDPDCRFYRTFPTKFTSPTISGTLGEGTQVIGNGEGVARPSDLAWTEQLEAGPNLLLLGRDAIAEYAELIRRTTDPITIDESGFTVGGTSWNEPEQSVLHTMHHPDNQGQYITVFFSNGDIGWQRMRLAWYYRKDTTVVWNGSQTELRRVFEPPAWMPVGNSGIVKP